MAKIVKINSENIERLSQGDLIKDVEFIEYAIEKKGDIEVSKINFPLIIVLTQDCDLNQDHIFRKSDPPIVSAKNS